MRKSETDITFILGTRGCGKSTLTHAISQNPKYDRKIVFDKLKEWEGDFIANTFEEFSGIWREHFHDPKFTILIRFKFAMPEEQMENMVAQIVSAIYHTGTDSEIEYTLIFEEAQFYFPNHSLNPVLMELLTTGRHAYTYIIANSQRPALVSKSLISLAAHVYFGQLFLKNDIDYLADTIGKELAEEAKKLPKLEFIYYPVGNPEGAEIIQL